MSLRAISNIFIGTPCKQSQRSVIDFKVCFPFLIAQRSAGQVQEDGFQVGFLDVDRGDADAVGRGCFEQARQHPVAVIRQDGQRAILGGDLLHTLDGFPGFHHPGAFGIDGHGDAVQSRRRS